MLHGCRLDVLTSTRETADELFRLFIPNDLSVHVSSVSARAPAMWVLLVLLEGPL